MGSRDTNTYHNRRGSSGNWQSNRDDRARGENGWHSNPRGGRGGRGGSSGTWTNRQHDSSSSGGWNNRQYESSSGDGGSNHRNDSTTSGGWQERPDNGWRGNNRGRGGRGFVKRGGGNRPHNNWDSNDDSQKPWNGDRRTTWSNSNRYDNSRYNNSSSKTEDSSDVLTGQAALNHIAKSNEERAKGWASIDFSQAGKDCDEYEAEKWGNYPPIVKNVYQEHPFVTNWPREEVEEYRKNANNITVQAPDGVKIEDQETLENIPNPIPSFEYAFINYPEIQKLLMDAGFEQPSPIQSQAWPLIMQGRDTIGIAQTGTGKTLAFLLPAYIHILSQTKIPDCSPGANILVLAPTRELAQQIHQEVAKFDYANLRSICIYGGVDRKKQIADLRQGCNVIIATPGRLDDLIHSGNIDITTITFVVLDEADRMLDCGFEPQIRKTMYKIRPDRQTIMTSATWPSGVQRLANSYMRNPVQVVIGSLDLAAVNSVEQVVEFVDDDAELKFNTLLDFIQDYGEMPELKVIIFATSKATASYVSSEITLRDVACQSIRGDMDQEEREYAIEALKAGEVKFLVATDVASRGIDIPDLTHVINYDFPRDIEEYVHRVGRTGRAGKTGKAITYFSRRDSRHAAELIKILEKANQEIPQELVRLSGNHERRMKRFEAEGRRPQNRSRYSYNH